MTWRSRLGPSCERAWKFLDPKLTWIWKYLKPVVLFILHGPQRDYSEPPGLSETLFPWPVRIAIVAGSWFLARVWVHTNPGGQIGWTLEYAGVVAISLVASFWLYIFLVDLVLSVAWLLLTLKKPPDPDLEPYWYWISHLVELGNRQLTHIQAFLIWMGVLLPFTPRIDVQFPALLGLALLGAPFIDWITQLIHPEVTRVSGKLQSARRPYIYVAMVVGLIILIARSQDQRLNLMRLAIALLFVTALRFLRHKVRTNKVDKLIEQTQQASATAPAEVANPVEAARAAKHAHHVHRFRKQQRKMTRGIDVMLGPVLMLAGVIGVLALSLWVRQNHDHIAREALDGPLPDPRSCVPEPGGPVRTDKTNLYSLFIVSDSQIHQLGGSRFPGQTELADLLVPSAVRPVELDMLGMSSVEQLKYAFREVVRDAHTEPVYWAHLGDFADLSCTRELERAVGVFSRFATPVAMGPAPEARQRRPKLAGIAPGNHDMSFTGNFFWSPYWSGACKPERAGKLASNPPGPGSEMGAQASSAVEPAPERETDGPSRADKLASTQVIARLLNPEHGVIPKDQVSMPDRSWPVRWLLGTGGMVTVTPLGTIQHQGKPRTVIAIFVDTGDDATFDFGIAGLFGTYSSNQDERLRALILRLQPRTLRKDGQSDPEIKDPLWIAFAHHPLGELTDGSRARLERTLEWLDRDPFHPENQRSSLLDPEPRLLGIIAAHTHRAETHRVCVAHRVVREIVVGSTIDSAQQGALLEIGTDEKGLAALRLRTVQTVARQGFTCRSGLATRGPGADPTPGLPAPEPPVVDAAECQRIVARLKCDSRCEPLFDEGYKGARDCTELEQTTGFGDAVRDLIGSSSPVDPTEIKKAQRLRAGRLLRCICRSSAGGSSVGPPGTNRCVGPDTDAPGIPVTGECAPIGDADPLDDDVFAARIAQRLEHGGDEARKELACLSWAASALQQHKARGMTFASALRCAFDDQTIPAEQETVATLDRQPCQ